MCVCVCVCVFVHAPYMLTRNNNVKIVEDRPRLIHDSLDPHESVPKRHLDRFNRFMHSSTVCITHIDNPTPNTLRASSVAIGRIYGLR